MNSAPIALERPLNIAVIGTGIAGMAAAWLLSCHHAVTVYEQNDWIGGHSHTVDALSKKGPIRVDTGFIVYNEVSYPNLVALFDYFDVPTKPSEMSFSASLQHGDFEYAGTDLNGLLGQRRNIVRPRFWRMVKNIMRFYKDAPAVLDNPADAELSLGEYLNREGYDQRFVDDHLLPMGAAIWSTTAAEIAAYPAQAFVRFFSSHGLLLLKNRPQWRTVKGGSHEYVQRLTNSYRDRIRFVGVRNVVRQDDKVIVVDRDGELTTYDHVVFGSHADETLGMLSDANAEECRLLGAWQYTENRAVLHSDPSLMPKRRRVWSSWNFLEGAANAQLCVTYWMNRLQTLESDEPLFLTLNPIPEPRADLIHSEFNYTHPYFNHAALASQRELWSLQGRRRTWFCGSYFGYGFHEDALQSGLAVAEQLGGVSRPWRVTDESGRINLLPREKGMAA